MFKGYRDHDIRKDGNTEAMIKKESVRELEKAALEIRKVLLELAVKEIIHIGSDLSVADIMTALWQYQMRYDPGDPKWEGRDRFVLSKGHAYETMALNQEMIGCFEENEVFTRYMEDGGRFAMHACDLVNRYVDVPSGSLGHGLPIACGMAAGLRLKGNHTSRVYVIMGDGEQTEGSVWEAAMNAVFHKLGNLVAIVDNNGLAGDGPLEDATSLKDIAGKYREFGWMVKEFDGNDMALIRQHLDQLPDPKSDKPIAFICHTVKGKGVPFMENQGRWHTGKITREQCDELVAHLEEEYTRKWGQTE